MNKAIFILFLLVSNLLVGQNLVPNPSFEDTVNCPTLDNQVFNASGWSNYSNQSPDYFHSCTSNSDIWVPSNWGGYQVPSSGNAYCAVSAFYQSTANGREIIGRNLSSNMVIGTKYYFSMKVNLSIDTFAGSSYACNKLGVRFSTIPYSSSQPIPISNNAHIWTDSIITDTLNWSLVFGSFVADAAYGYLALGNFFTDINTDTLKIVNGTPPYIFAYYYIDDVCLSIDSLEAYNFVGVKEKQNFTDVKIFPNPTTSHFSIEGLNKPYNLTIYNAIGQLLYTKSDILETSKRVDVSKFTKGLIFVRIESEDEAYYQKIIKE